MTAAPTSVRAAATGAVATWPRRILLAATVLLGAAVAVLVALGEPGAAPAAVNAPVQLAMSVLVPAVGVVPAHDACRRGPAPRAGLAVAVAATVWAMALGLVGAALALLALGTASGAGPVLAAGAAAQVVAALVGAASGFLVRGPWWAFAATVVVPLGAWLLIGLLGPGPQQWLTPFGALSALLAPAPTGTDVVAWLVVLLLWGVVATAAGIAVATRRGGGADRS